MVCKRMLAVVAAVLLLAAGHALAQDDIKGNPGCPHCGMDRGEYKQSRMLIIYADGATVGTCSLRCTALELRTHKDKVPRSIQVADYDSGVLIDADHAVWVIQYNTPGVMTKRAKWAFRNNEGMEHFLRGRTGARATWKEVLNLATEELPKEK